MAIVPPFIRKNKVVSLEIHCHLITDEVRLFVNQHHIPCPTMDIIYYMHDRSWEREEVGDWAVYTNI